MAMELLKQTAKIVTSLQRNSLYPDVPTAPPPGSATARSSSRPNSSAGCA
jgi:hypothetical protein